MAPPFVKRYLVALDRHKWAGLAGFIVVMGLSGVAALQPAPPASYASEGRLAYSVPPVTLSQTGSALQQQGQALTEETLLSDYVIKTVVQQLESRDVDVDPDALRRNAEVSIETEESQNEDQPPRTEVTVTYRNSDPETAEIVTVLLLDAMVEQSRLFNTQQISGIIDNLNQLLPKVTRELQQAESNLEQYTRQEGPAIQAAEDGNLVQAITSAREQQRQTQLSLASVNAQIRSIQQRLGLSPAQAYTSSALSADPIIADLRTQIYQTESQMQILSQDLRPDHPTMVQLRNQQQAYEQLLRDRVSEVIGGNQVAAPLPQMSEIRQGSSLDPARQQLANALVNLETQRDTLQQQLAALTQSEQALRREYANLPDKQLARSRLENQVALKRTFYDQVQARIADVTLAQEETVGSLIVIQPPRTQLASEPGANSIVILAVGGLVGLLVGGGLVLLLDSLDATFHTLPDLQVALRQQEVPVFGLLPLLPSSDDVEELPLVAEPDSAFVEPYERFRGNLRRATSGKPLKVVLLTSTVSGEGKTVSAFNLAIASARAGKRTLLIEADLRSPSQAPALKVTPDTASAIEPLRYYAHLSDCIRLVPEVENLYILPSPGYQRQAAAILESSEMRHLLEDARGRFDLVILDTPALSRFNDALLLEPYTDGLVLVTRPGYTEEGLLNEAVEQFMESEDIQFLGAVINGADIPLQSSELDDDSQFIVEDLDNRQDLEKLGMS
jgi:capsular exopolysaccharide synthesis family protein